MYKFLWIRHWNDFVREYPRKFENTFGKLERHKIDEAKKLIRCGKFRNGFARHKWRDRKTGEKLYATKTMDVYLFMALMLYFLPEKNRKMVRYYGIYAHGIDDNLKIIDRRTWAKGIEKSFDKDPVICPECSAEMLPDTVYSNQADMEIKVLVKMYMIIKGYFKPRIRPS